MRSRHLLLAGLLAFLVACGGGAAPTAGDISAEETLARIEKSDAPLLLDVRTPEEFAAGHVPAAWNLPIDQLPARLAELASHRSSGVIVYCERGPRAARAIEELRAAGFTDVQHLSGDMSGWREAGLPVER
jgi:rhodanese-related sulfurtransferase